MSCGYFQQQPFWMAYRTGFGDFHLANLLMVHPYFIGSAAFIEARLASDLNKRLPGFNHVPEKRKLRRTGG